MFSLAVKSAQPPFPPPTAKFNVLLVNVVQRLVVLVIMLIWSCLVCSLFSSVSGISISSNLGNLTGFWSDKTLFVFIIIFMLSRHVSYHILSHHASYLILSYLISSSIVSYIISSHHIT